MLRVQFRCWTLSSNQKKQRATTQLEPSSASSPFAVLPTSSIADPRCIPYNDVCEACLDSRTACTFDMPLSTSRSKRVRRGLGLAPGETLASGSGSGSATVGTASWVSGQTTRLPAGNGHAHMTEGTLGTGSDRGWSEGRSSLSTSPAPWSRGKAPSRDSSRGKSRGVSAAEPTPSHHREGKPRGSGFDAERRAMCTLSCPS